jgi:NAD(P)-dependent dehydrogenase (short-subunit alcohol dehydrogenase family)
VWTYDRNPGGPCDAARHVVGDVRDADALEALIGLIVAAHGALDALVACAGAKVRGRIEAVSPAAFDEALAINLTGAFLTARSAIGPMRAAGGGAIVFVGSGSAYGDPDAIAYAAAKGGLHALAASLAPALAGDRIRVNTVVPGFVDSPMAADTGRARRAAIAAAAASGRLTTPDDVADMVGFLCSPAAVTVSGGVFDVGHFHQRPVATTAAEAQ